MIESYLDDEQPSSKKRRQDSSVPLETAIVLPLQSPRKPNEAHSSTKSPRKQRTIRKSKSPRNINDDDMNMNSPTKNLNCYQENVNTYEVTSDLPNIKSVDCDPEDWVFQKREKAKVSCFFFLHLTNFIM